MRRRMLVLLTVSALFCHEGRAQLVAANTQMSMFYAGVEDPLEVAVSGYPARSIVFRAKLGELKRTGSKGYTWKCCGCVAGRVRFTVFL